MYFIVLPFCFCEMIRVCSTVQVRKVAVCGMIPYQDTMNFMGEKAFK
jgi:hypothetical protein